MQHSSRPLFPQTPKALQQRANPRSITIQHSKQEFMKLPAMPVSEGTRRGSDLVSEPSSSSATESHFSVRSCFNGGVVFLTGCTGYVGSLVLEQLLRTCPGVTKIYVLARAKRTMTAKERIDWMLQTSPLFQLVREAGPHLAAKVVVVEGDLAGTCKPKPTTASQQGKPQLQKQPQAPSTLSALMAPLRCFGGSPGLGNKLCASQPKPAEVNATAVAASGSCGTKTAAANGHVASRLPSTACSLPLGIKDSVLLEQVVLETTHVIHCAARIALEEGIQTTLLHNYCGTKTLLELAQHMPSLASFTHVSSTYANANLPLGSTVQEEVYPLFFGDREVDHVDQVCRLMGCEASTAEAKATALRHLWGFPNNYTMGKRLTELLVRDYNDLLSAGVTIVRPSLIGALAGDPCPGYTGNMAGPTGFALAYGLGFFVKNSVAWHGDRIMDGVPGELVSGVVIAAAAVAGAGWQLMQGQLVPPKEFHQQDGKPVQQYVPNRQILMVVQAASSTVNPIANWEVFNIAHKYFTERPPKFKIFMGSYNNDYSSASDCGSTPEPKVLEKAKAKVARRVRLVARLLRCIGHDREASKLEIGHQQWAEGNVAKTNLLLYFSCSAAVALESALAPDERQDFMLVWRGDWLAYSKTYLDWVCERYMGGGKRNKK